MTTIAAIYSRNEEHTAASIDKAAFDGPFAVQLSVDSEVPRSPGEGCSLQPSMDPGTSASTLEKEKAQNDLADPGLPYISPLTATKLNQQDGLPASKICPDASNDTGIDDMQPPTSAVPATPKKLAKSDPLDPKVFGGSPKAKDAADPNFLGEFFQNSRLHHISTMGANAKVKIFFKLVR